MNIPDRSFDDIKLGDEARFERSITEEDVATFAKLTGDHNPLHTDDAYAKTSAFGKRIVHGMLVASLTSTLLGMHMPGKRCLYLGEKLSFKKPVFIGDTVSVSGEVIHKSAATRTLTISISIRRGTDIVVSGEALAQVLA